MNLQQAIEVRSAQLRGEPVHAITLQHAIDVIQKATVKKGRPYKFRWMRITNQERDRVNGVLLFNLGMAIGRMR